MTVQNLKMNQEQNSKVEEHTASAGRPSLSYLVYIQYQEKETGAT